MGIIERGMKSGELRKCSTIRGCNTNHGACCEASPCRYSPTRSLKVKEIIPLVQHQVTVRIEMTVDAGYSDTVQTPDSLISILPELLRMLTEFRGSPVNAGLRPGVLMGLADDLDKWVVPRQLEVSDHVARLDMGVGKNIGGGIDRTARNFASQYRDDFLTGQLRCPLDDFFFHECLVTPPDEGVPGALVIYQVRSTHGLAQRLPVTGAGSRNGNATVPGWEKSKGHEVRVVLAPGTEFRP